MNMKTSKHFTLTLLSLVIYLGTSPCIAKESQLVGVQPALQPTTLTGFTRARHSLPIASEISGKVTHIYADIGQAIPENGIFSCLDKTFIKLDIASTENSIAQHSVDLKYLSKQVARHKKLVKTNSAAISLLDDLMRQKDNAYRAIQQEKINKQKQLETKSRHCIKAPKNWKLTQRNIEVGQWITAESAIAQADDYSQLLIPLTLTTQELRSLEKKQNKLTIYLPEYQQELAASIERISPAFDEKSHKIRVDLLITDTEKYNRGGIRVELKLELPDKLNTFYIPVKALDERFEEVWLTRKNGQKIRVMLLDYIGDDRAKISSSMIKMSDQFKLQQP